MNPKTAWWLGTVMVGIGFGLVAVLAHLTGTDGVPDKDAGAPYERAIAIREHAWDGEPSDLASPASIQATHYPDLTQSSPTLAGTGLNAFTPSQSLTFLQPGGKLIYGTAGITHSSGIVHGLVLTQELQIADDDPSPAGTILGAASHGYLRTIQLDILATASNAIPNAGDALTFSAAPANCANYRVESAEVKFQEKRGKMYSLTAVWIPPLG